MRAPSLLPSALLLGALAGVLPATPAPGDIPVYNTGTWGANTGCVGTTTLSAGCDPGIHGGFDSNRYLTTGSKRTNTGLPIVPGTTAIATPNADSWLPGYSPSTWIFASDPLERYSPRAFVYQCQFSVETGQLASATPITGRFAAEDSGSLPVNDDPDPGVAFAGWNSWTPFTVPTSMIEVGESNPGLAVTRSGNAGFGEAAFRMEFASAAVPEGGESAALTLGLGLALLAWRRMKAAASPQ